MDARYTWADSGEEPRFVRALVGDDRLALLEVGYPDGETVLEQAGLTVDDEITVHRA